VSRLSRQCGILNISQLYRSPRPVKGIDLFHLLDDMLKSWLSAHKNSPSHTFKMWFLTKWISSCLIFQILSRLVMKLKFSYDWQSVGQSILVSCSHLEPMRRFVDSVSDNCEFLVVGLLLWRRDGSVIYSYNCFLALPKQSLSGPSPSELTIISYSLIWDSPDGWPGPRIHILKKCGYPIIHPGTRFHFHRLL
jgi:hypothetical protein